MLGDFASIATLILFVIYFILANIRRLQTFNNIKLSPSLVKDLGRCSLDIEMETGTGKTYVYIKTMFELNKRYGWSKYIVVVPSIAIREGVKKSFEITAEHFMEQYGKLFGGRIPKNEAISVKTGVRFRAFGYGGFFGALPASF